MMRVSSTHGLPAHGVHSYRQDSEHERKHGPSEVGGFTFVTYAELRRINWDSVGVRPLESEWSTVFRVLEALGSRFNHEKIRIVTSASGQQHTPTECSGRVASIAHLLAATDRKREGRLARRPCSPPCSPGDVTSSVREPQNRVRRRSELSALDLVRSDGAFLQFAHQFVGHCGTKSAAGS
jgi:hypothetical protein